MSGRIRTSISQILMVVALVVAVLGVMTARVLYSGEQELELSSDALGTGDVREAVVRARRAAGWYAPGAPHVRVAYMRLLEIARVAEERRKPELALFTWRGVRAAATESRWISQPYAAELELANREIARLAAQELDDTPRAGESEVLEALTRGESPRRPWTVALLLGFTLWFGGLVWTARSAADVAGKMVWKRARLPLVMTLVGISLWLGAVWRA